MIAPADDDWAPVHQWLRDCQAGERIGRTTAARSWHIAVELVAAVPGLPAPDTLEHDAAGAVRYAWDRGGRHRLEVTIAPDGLVDLEYLDRVSGETWAQYGAAVLVGSDRLGRQIRLAAGLPPRAGTEGEDP